MRIIHIYNFKNYKILTKERFSYFSKIKSSTKKRKNKQIVIDEDSFFVEFFFFYFFNEFESDFKFKKQKKIKRKIKTFKFNNVIMKQLTRVKKIIELQKKLNQKNHKIIKNTECSKVDCSKRDHYY